VNRAPGVLAHVCDDGDGVRAGEVDALLLVAWGDAGEALHLPLLFVDARDAVDNLLARADLGGGGGNLTFLNTIFSVGGARKGSFLRGGVGGGG
jgi:hypothetical protein